MTAPRQDLIVQEGETWAFSCVARDASGEPRDLTGHTARAVIADAFGGAAIKELTTENGGIWLDGGSGSLTLVMSAEQTASLRSCDILEYAPAGISDRYDRGAGSHLASRPRHLVHDVDLIDQSGVVSRVLTGRMILYPSAAAGGAGRGESQAVVYDGGTP